MRYSGFNFLPKSAVVDFVAVTILLFAISGNNALTLWRYGEVPGLRATELRNYLNLPSASRQVYIGETNRTKALYGNSGGRGSAGNNYGSNVLGIMNCFQ